MKKNLLKTALFLLCGIGSMSLSANDYVFETFDAMPQTWSPVVTNSAQIVNNLSKEALNPSNKALCIVRHATEDHLAGAKSESRTSLNKEALTGYQYVHVMMYPQTTGTPALKINNNAAEISPVTGTTIVPEVWQDVVFDISTISEGVDFIYFIANYTPTISNNDSVLIDNIILTNEASPRTATIAAEAVIDSHIYESKGALNQYSLENNWLYSQVTNNYPSTKYAAANQIRGMAVLDGYIYLPVRSERALRVIDAFDGTVVDTIAIASNVLTDTIKASDNLTDSVISVGVLPFNDLKVDGAGNLLTFGAVGMPFEIWTIDPETGAGSLIIKEDLRVSYPDANIRFDAFGVYGDVKSSAVILAANANSMEVYKWTITNGVADAAELIELDDPWNPSKELVNPGSAPQIFPVDNSYFFLDGNATFPTLYNNNGALVDGFYNNQSLLTDKRISGSDTTNIVMNEGHNGLQEFQIGEDYFIIMAGRNTVASAGRASYFSLFKYADAAKEFTKMELMWRFPDAGMGTSSNAYRTAMPCVEVDGYQAHISVYVGENGLANYTMKNLQIANEENEDVAVVNPTSDNHIQFYVNDAIVTLSENAKIEVYNLMGQQVATAANTNTIALANQGIYIVKATSENGKVSVEKVIIK